MPQGLSLVAGGGGPARPPGAPGRWRAGQATPVLPEPGDLFDLPEEGPVTLSELFSGNPRDGGWAGFLLPQLPPGRPWLWVQERMAILESGRIYPPGLGPGAAGLIHVAARDSREALWTMEEGLRCAAIGAVIGEIYGDPAVLDFTATRRLAVAAERHGVAAYLIRLGGHANLSGARRRWRVASSPSLGNPLNARASGAPSWQAQLFRMRDGRPGEWTIAHEGAGEKGRFRLVAGPADRTLDQGRHALTG